MTLVKYTLLDLRMVEKTQVLVQFIQAFLVVTLYTPLDKQESVWEVDIMKDHM